MINIKTAIEKVTELKPYSKFLNDFAREEYNKKGFKTGVNLYNYYTGYKIINERCISVEYKYGYGDYDYDGSFDVDITNELRNDKIKEIL